MKESFYFFLFFIILIVSILCLKGSFIIFLVSFFGVEKVSLMFLKFFMLYVVVRKVLFFF